MPCVLEFRLEWLEEPAIEKFSAALKEFMRLGSANANRDPLKDRAMTFPFAVEIVASTRYRSRGQKVCSENCRNLEQLLDGHCPTFTLYLKAACPFPPIGTIFGTR